MNNPDKATWSAESLREVRTTAEELLQELSGPTITDSPLFPYGISRVRVRVKAGDIEIRLEVSGPEHGDGEDDDWMGSDVEDLFDEEENGR
jgi:hypothetical protein